MPQKRDPKTNPKALLGKRLRLGRIAAGFSSQDALAARLGFDRTVIAKAETGDRPPTLDVLAAWCEACGLDADLFADLTELAGSGDGPIPTWFEDYLGAEREAQSLLIWSPIVIPGLLQTPDYARALLLAQQTDTSDDAIDALVNARLDRQAIFDRAEPPDVTVVLDEAVLHRLIGSPAVMHDALAHVAEMSVGLASWYRSCRRARARTPALAGRSTSPVPTAALTCCARTVWKTRPPRTGRWCGSTE
jgi:transcriptional regulator with XRE-family HTH domain